MVLISFWRLRGTHPNASVALPLTGTLASGRASRPPWTPQPAGTNLPVSPADASGGHGVANVIPARTSEQIG